MLVVITGLWYNLVILTSWRRMVNQVVSMVEAKSHLAELVGQVRFAGKRYILERRGRPMAMLISIEEYEQLQEQASARASGKTSPLPPELQQRQKLLVERARQLERRYGDPVAGLAELFSTLPPSEDDFWLEIQEI
jgi:prevent-host-death family protein